MGNVVQCEVWMVIDESGNHAVGTTQEEAQESYNDIHNEDGCKRMVCVTVSIPVPEPVKVAVTVPAEAGECVVAV